MRDVDREQNRGVFKAPDQAPGRPPLGAPHLGAPASLPANTSHKGWFARGYLPHFDCPNLNQSITFHLADSLPRAYLEALAEELRILQRRQRRFTEKEVTTSKNHAAAGERAPDRAAPTVARQWRIEELLDKGMGDCYLRDERVAMLVEDALLHFDGKRYRLFTWCVMPNHVHALIETIPGYSLPKVLHSWKSYTASQANKVLGRTGDFWHREYFDRFIRDANHFQKVVRYIEQNPVKAGLVKIPEDWRFGSAFAGKDAGAPRCRRS